MQPQKKKIKNIALTMHHYQRFYAF